MVGSLEWHRIVVSIQHLCRFDTSYCPWWTGSKNNTDFLLVWYTMYQFLLGLVKCVIASVCIQLLCTLVVPKVWHWNSVPWRISYADLDGSLHSIWSMLGEFLAWGRSWSHGCIGKFVTVEHKPVMKWFLMVWMFFLQHWLSVIFVEQIGRWWICLSQSKKGLYMNPYSFFGIVYQWITRFSFTAVFTPEFTIFSHFTFFNHHMYTERGLYQPHTSTSYI